MLHTSVCYEYVTTLLCFVGSKSKITGYCCCMLKSKPNIIDLMNFALIERD